MDPVGRWQSRPRVQRWLQRRLPPAREVTLNQRRIFIFLSREGGLYAALLLITFIAGINYANNLILMLCFLLSSVLVVSLHQTYFQLSGLHLELVDPEQDVVSGQSVQVRLRLSGQRAHHELELSTPSQRLVLRPFGLGQGHRAHTVQTFGQLGQHAVAGGRHEAAEVIDAAIAA